MVKKISNVELMQHVTDYGIQSFSAHANYLECSRVNLFLKKFDPQN